EEREHEVVVPRIEVEVGLGDDAPRLSEVVIRLFDGPDGRDLGELDDRLRLDVDHDATGDVVHDDRTVGDVGNRAEVRDDPARGRLVVARDGDEEPSYADLGRCTPRVAGASGGARA